MNDKNIVSGDRSRQNGDTLCGGNAVRVAICCAVCTIVALIFASFQLGFFNEIRPLGVTPDRCLALTVAAGFRFGKRIGGVVGVAAGFFLDSLSLSGISLLIPFYLMCGVVSGFYYGAKDRVFRRLLVFYAIVAVACMIKQTASAIWVLIMAASFELGKIFSKLFFAEIAVTLLFSVLSYMAVAGICVIVRKFLGTSH